MNRYLFGGSQILILNTSKLQIPKSTSHIRKSVGKGISFYGSQIPVRPRHPGGPVRPRHPGGPVRPCHPPKKPGQAGGLILNTSKLWNIPKSTSHIRKSVGALHTSGRARGDSRRCTTFLDFFASFNDFSPTCTYLNHLKTW